MHIFFSLVEEKGVLMNGFNALYGMNLFMAYGNVHISYQNNVTICLTIEHWAHYLKPGKIYHCQNNYEYDKIEYYASVIQKLQNELD